MLSQSDPGIVMPHAELWQQTIKQLKIPQNNCACLKTQKEKMAFSTKTGHLKLQNKHMGWNKSVRDTNSSGAHVDACRQGKWGMLGFRSLWLHLPHIKNHWSYSRARPKSHASGYTRSVTSQLFAIFITHTTVPDFSFLLSLICRHKKIHGKTHVYSHVATTTHDLSYPDLCALDWRARLWCIVHRKAWFNTKNRKSPHKISVSHFDKSGRNNVILTELSLSAATVEIKHALHHWAYLNKL